jgi:dGTPase
MHKSLLETAQKVKDWLTRLFEKLCQKPDLMPGYFQRFIPEESLHRIVTDYIAGMTDRFALKTLNEIKS